MHTHTHTKNLLVKREKKVGARAVMTHCHLAKLDSISRVLEIVGNQQKLALGFVWCAGPCPLMMYTKPHVFIKRKGNFESKK